MRIACESVKLYGEGGADEQIAAGLGLLYSGLTLMVKQMNYIRAIEARLDSHTYKGN